jgi:hypothetical protein
MTFDGFYYDWKWWWGATSLTRQFNFPSPVNVYAFGALTTSWVTSGQGCAYVGIIEETKIDPNTGRPVIQATPIPGQALGVPNLVDKEVTSLTFAFGSTVQGQPQSPIHYANANLNVILWS